MRKHTEVGFIDSLIEERYENSRIEIIETSEVPTM